MGPTTWKLIDNQPYVEADFELEIGGSISGTVYEADGVTPILDTPVIAVSEICVNGATTDNNGNYEIKNLREGNYVIGVIPFGYASVVKENNLVSKSQNLQNININLSPNKSTCLTGIVKSKITGEPIKDALVAIFTDKKGGLALTDAEGKYKICGLDEGTYDIAVGGEGYEIKEEVNIEISSNQEIVKDFNLIKQTQQGFNYKKESNKFGLNKNFFKSFIYEPVYAFQPGTSEYKCCISNCMKGFGWWNCLIPSNPLAWILVVLCGPMPTPNVAPWSGRIIKKFFSKLLPPLNIFCTVYNIAGPPVCIISYYLGCVTGCL